MENQIVQLIKKCKQIAQNSEKNPNDKVMQIVLSGCLKSAIVMVKMQDEVNKEQIKR